jgi:hypothetical protein
MMNNEPGRIWWERITGPSSMINKVIRTVMTQNVLLLVPSDIPYRHDMRALVNSGAYNCVVEIIDSKDECPDITDIGKYLLESQTFDDRIKAGYRVNSRESIQQYIARNRVLEKKILWIKGLDKKQAILWVEFCRHYPVSGLESGCFIIEYCEDLLSAVEPNMKMVAYDSYVIKADVRLFISIMLNLNGKAPDDNWKRYMEAVISEMCGTDAEIAFEMLERTDFLKEEPQASLKRIADSQAFALRGKEAGSSHILAYARRCDDTLEKRIWMAQLQVAFPLVEQDRIEFITKWRQEIQKSLGRHNIIQFFEKITEPEDLEIGTLAYMLNNGKVAIRNEADRDKINFLREIRNRIAHGKCCSPEELRKLFAIAE